MGEEVVDPSRTIPRAIVLALGGGVAVYALVAVVVLLILGTNAAHSTTSLAEIVAGAGWNALAPLVHVAAAACLGTLLALLTSISRTTLARARASDLPRFLAKVDERWQVPRRAEIVIAVTMIGIVLVADLRDGIDFSSFGVQLYYLIANAAAFRQAGTARRYLHVLQVIGALGCLVLLNALPVPASLIGAGVV